jgi:hypothetical protein
VLRLLILTLHVDEPQLSLQSAQISALKVNKVYHIKHIVISGMRAGSAMRQLYQEIREHSNFDYFIKLDADMTFRDLNSLGDLIDKAVTSQKNRYTISVFDHATRLNIFGLHVVKVKAIKDTVLITDLKRDDWIAEIDGTSVILRTPLIDHCKTPSDFQLFCFGYNRGLKHKIKKQNMFPIFIVTMVNCIFDRQYKFVARGFIKGCNLNKPEFDSELLRQQFAIVKSVTWKEVLKVFLQNTRFLPTSILIAIYLKFK